VIEHVRSFAGQELDDRTDFHDIQRLKLAFLEEVSDPLKLSETYDLLYDIDELLLFKYRRLPHMKPEDLAAYVLGYTFVARTRKESLEALINGTPVKERPPEPGPPHRPRPPEPGEEDLPPFPPPDHG
jgi:hypothetical protein